MHGGLLGLCISDLREVLSVGAVGRAGNPVGPVDGELQDPLELYGLP